MAIKTLETDPCGRASDLRAIRDQIVTGSHVVEAEFEAGNGTRRHVKYAKADLDSLNALIAQAESACSIASGGKPRRYAMAGRFLRG